MSALTLLIGRQEGHLACKNMGDDGGGHCLVRMEWRSAGWSVCHSVNLPLHHEVQKFSSGTCSPRWSRKRAIKWLWWWCGLSWETHLQSIQVWHVLTRDYTVLPVIHTFIHKSNEPYLPLLPSCTASPHFGRYLFFVPLRVESWVGLSGWSQTEVVYPPAQGHPSQC